MVHLGLQDVKAERDELVCAAAVPTELYCVGRELPVVVDGQLEATGPALRAQFTHAASTK